MDWTLDWTGLEKWVQLLLAIDYFIGDREVMVLWLQVSRSPGCCVICRCRAGYTRLGAVSGGSQCRYLASPCLLVARSINHVSLDF